MPRSLFIALAASILAPSLLNAQDLCTLQPEQRLDPDDAHSAIRSFGFDVAIDGDWMAIGAPADKTNIGSEGTVRMYRRGAHRWIEDASLKIPDGQQHDVFGWAVDLDGDVLIASALWRGTAGAAFIFRFDGSQWNLEQELTPSDGISSQDFGEDVAISHNLAVVGSPFDPDQGQWAGSAYVYQFDGTTWQEIQELHPDDPDDRALFGFSVEVEGASIVVGAPFERPFDADQHGAVFAFRWKGGQWEQEAHLIASDGGFDDQFGTSLSYRGGRLLIGSPGWDADSAANCGAAYLFRRDPSSHPLWTEDQVLHVPTAIEGEALGWSVSLDETTAVAGAPGDWEQLGRAYLFRHRDTWVVEKELQTDEQDDGSFFGSAVAHEGEVAVVANYADVDDDGGNGGAAYAYDASELVLQALPWRPEAGETLTFNTCIGQPSALVLLAATAIDDAPLFWPIAIDSFDDHGAHAFSAEVPPGLDGLAVSFQSFGFLIDGTLDATREERIEFR